MAHEQDKIKPAKFYSFHLLLLASCVRVSVVSRHSNETNRAAQKNYKNSKIDKFTESKFVSTIVFFFLCVTDC